MPEKILEPKLFYPRNLRSRHFTFGQFEVLLHKLFMTEQRGSLTATSA